MQGGSGSKTLVTMVSPAFLKGHPRAGEPTLFIEKIWSGLLQVDDELYTDYLTGEARPDDMHPADYYRDFEPKYHTVRSRYRFKDGDSILLKAWTGKPYRSKQIVIAPRIEVKVFGFTIVTPDRAYVNEKQISTDTLKLIAKNDGLAYQDFIHWFSKPLDGQIICWNPKIKY